MLKIESETHSYMRYFAKKIYWNIQSYIWDSYLETSDYQSEIRQIVSHIHSTCTKQPASLLDLGCATGLYAIPLQKIGFKVTGYDFAWLMIRRAKKNAKKLRVAGIRFSVTDFNKQGNFANCSYDAVLSAHAIGTGFSKPGIFNDIASILTDGGFFYMVVKTKKTGKGNNLPARKKLLVKALQTVRKLSLRKRQQRSYHHEQLLNDISDAGFHQLTCHETEYNRLYVFQKSTVHQS